MERSELVDQVLARVVAKLAEREHAPCCGCSSGDPEKPGVLIVTREHGEHCHPVLEDPALLEHYHTECALMEGYLSDLTRFDAVVIFGLTIDAQCKLAAGICDDPYTALLQRAILAGKRLFAPIEEVEQPSAATPAPYAAMLREKLEFLVSCGLYCCPLEGLVPAILGGAAPVSAVSAPPAAVPAVEEERTKEISLTKRVLTERDISAADGQKAGCIHIGEKAILTALAAELARSKGIRLIRDL